MCIFVGDAARGVIICRLRIRRLQHLSAPLFSLRASLCVDLHSSAVLYSVLDNAVLRSCLSSSQTGLPGYSRMSDRLSTSLSTR